MVDVRDQLSEEFLDSEIVNDEFFISTIENKLKISRDDFKLRLVLISPAIGKNENFVSIVYRAKIKIELKNLEKQSIDVIIKVLSAKGMKEYKVYPREVLMYEKILTKFEKTWNDKTGEEICFGPKSIKFVVDPFDVMVLEDLKIKKYEMLDRRVGLNMEQSKMFLSKLAKFHAISALHYQQEGVIDNLLDRRVSNPPVDPNSPFVQVFGKVLKSFVTVLNKDESCRIYAEKIAKWSISNMFTLFTDIAEPMRNGFNCLNHGDDFLNNMMFRLDENKNPLEVIFVDFQACMWASPAPDLLYFMISSIADDIKVDHFDDFIEYYHNELTSSLKKLNYESHIPTLSELHLDILDKGSYGAMCTAFIMFIVKFDSNEEMNLDLLMSTDSDNLNRLYSNENYLKSLKKWLPFLNKRGFLDCLIKE